MSAELDTKPINIFDGFCSLDQQKIEVESNWLNWTFETDSHCRASHPSRVDCNDLQLLGSSSSKVIGNVKLSAAGVVDAAHLRESGIIFQ
jgi:hypothetical protein